MEIESVQFTRADLEAFADELVEHERVALADRLERDSARLAELAAQLDESNARRARDGGWSAHEILAHIAVFSKFHGMLTYKVGSGQFTEIDLLGSVQQRDTAGARMAALLLPELLQAIQSGHRHTVEYLRSADATAMKRRVDIGDASLSADEIARLFLCAHLDQLERAIAT